MKYLFHFILFIVCGFIYFLSPMKANAQGASNPKLIWYRDTTEEGKDYYVAFRGQWNLSEEKDCEIHLLGASWFAGWLDGRYFCQGPARFPASHPQYQTYRTHLAAGYHTLAIEVHQVGEVTRMLKILKPFLYCDITAGELEISVNWKCLRLKGYASQVRRINPELGFIEWCDTRQQPRDWEKPGFEDAQWPLPEMVHRQLGSFMPLSTKNTLFKVHALEPVASGQLADRFGYEKDDPAARFFLCDLSPSQVPPQGVWRRYDLGRVRLIQPKFVLDLPAGAVVEFAYSEELLQGRVTPWITLSAGESCNMDHYVARGGKQEFFPITPKGGRFLALHVYAPPDQIRFISEQVLETCYYGEPEGSLKTNDTLLNKIWLVGVATLRACSEDALVDNPTRERGQWTGDVSVGMDIAASAYADLGLLRRSLVQASQCARSDGLVAGLSPGGTTYISTYAAAWISACVHYWELTGDKRLLEELFPAMEKDVGAFEKQNTRQGLRDSLGWGFVDWGYVRNSGPSDIAVNLYYLAALRQVIRWCDAVGRKDRGKCYEAIAGKMTAIIARYYQSEFDKKGNTWTRIGYHRAVLGMWLGFFSGDKERDCLIYIRHHMLQCFPNDSDAPRLSDPEANNPRLITPYFGNLAMPILIQHGGMDFVLDQYRKCWGWMLNDDRTTWLEVFDTRWSHCHQWSGCPTWQMSRYLLGLQPRYDLGARHYELKLYPGSLLKASGTIPLPDNNSVISISWVREADGMHYHLKTPVPIYLHINERREGHKSKVVHIEKEFETVFKGI